VWGGGGGGGRGGGGQGAAGLLQRKLKPLNHITLILSHLMHSDTSIHQKQTYVMLSTGYQSMLFVFFIFSNQNMVKIKLF